MSKNVTEHDATTDLSSTFTAARSTKLVITIKWTGITGASASSIYFLKQSMIDLTGGDPVPAIPDGITITNGTDSVTFESLSPADKFEHEYTADTVSAGTIEIVTKIIYLKQ